MRLRDVERKRNRRDLTLSVANLLAIYEIAAAKMRSNNASVLFWCSCERLRQVFDLFAVARSSCRTCKIFNGKGRRGHRRTVQVSISKRVRDAKETRRHADRKEERKKREPKGNSSCKEQQNHLDNR